ncbi:hypothetical protein E6P97_02770 [Patescibacteria group bacterium]|nr:MAG: hypothetical protein E6P97_02770 [Patescibacteria group bacterium]
MNKKYIIGVIVAAVVVVGGVATYVATHGDGDGSGTETANEVREDAKTAAAFNAVANSDVPFEATMTGKGEREYTATLRYDGKGNSSYSSNYGDGPVAMYLFGDEHISCFGTTCMRLPDSNGDGNVTNAKRTYSEADLNEFRNSATLKGEGVSCGDETCSVWDVKTEKFNGTFHLDSQGRMQKVEGEQDGNTWVIEYTYKPVEIERPTNVVDSPLM